MFGYAVLPLSAVGEYAKKRIPASAIDETSYVGVENLLQNRGGKTNATSVPTEGQVVAYQKGDILIGNIRPYLKKIWQADREGGTNGDVLAVHITSCFLTSRFLYHILASESFFTYDNQYAKGAKMPRGDKEAVMNYMISVPAITEQERIVSILDRFDVLCNDITAGLPAEIEARQKQYEYYRDELLTFKEATS